MGQAHEKPREDKSKKKVLGRPRSNGLKINGLSSWPAKKSSKQA